MKVLPHFDTVCAVLGADTAQDALTNKATKKKKQPAFYIDSIGSICNLN